MEQYLTYGLLALLVLGAFILRYAWSRQEKALIEKAMELDKKDVLEALVRGKRNRRLFLGLLLAAVGIALVLCHYLNLMPGEQNVAGAGLVLVFAGIALVLFYHLTR